MGTCSKWWNQQNLELTWDLSTWQVRKIWCFFLVVHLKLECVSPDPWLQALSTLQSSFSILPQNFPLYPQSTMVFCCCCNPSNFFSTSLYLDKSYLYLLYREEGPVKHHYLKGNYYCNNEFFHILEGKCHFLWGEGKCCFSTISSILESLWGPIWAPLFCACIYIYIWTGEVLSS